MTQLPDNAEIIKIEGSTVDFYKFSKKDKIYYYFDTSDFPVPHPMINAMKGLELLDKNSFLIMINHKLPLGLFPKIEKVFSYRVTELSNKVEIVFELKSNSENDVAKIDFNDTICKG